MRGARLLKSAEDDLRGLHRCCLDDADASSIATADSASPGDNDAAASAKCRSSMVVIQLQFQDANKLTKLASGTLHVCSMFIRTNSKGKESQLLRYQMEKRNRSSLRVPHTKLATMLSKCSIIVGLDSKLVPLEERKVSPPSQRKEKESFASAVFSFFELFFELFFSELNPLL